MKTSIASAIAFLLLYAALIHFLPTPSRLKLQSQWQENRRTVEQFFLKQPAERMVFAGSSLTRRLDLKNGLACAYNLAVDGESTLTGLSAVQAARHKPARVFAEINVPERPVSQSLIDHGRSRLLQLSPVFLTENIPTNYLYSTISSWRQREITHAPVNPIARASELARQTSAYSKPLDSQVLANSIANYQSVIASLREQGVSVTLFEMPIHPSLESSARASQVRAAFIAAFGRANVLDFNALAEGVSIDTVDGLHLSVDEARAVVTNLARSQPCP